MNYRFTKKRRKRILLISWKAVTDVLGLGLPEPKKKAHVIFELLMTYVPSSSLRCFVRP